MPPVIEEPITRLVHSEIGLPELWARTAELNKIHVEMVYVDALAGKLIEFLKSKNVKRVMMPVSALLEKVGIRPALQAAGFDVKRWDEMTLDEAYDFDCGLTDATYAVAETGSVVIRATPEHGRILSLAPPIHVAVLEPKNFVPDLVDLFDRLAIEGSGSGVTLITGPSKTSDIEMNLVVGVHGPVTVQAFVLQ